LHNQYFRIIRRWINSQKVRVVYSYEYDAGYSLRNFINTVDLINFKKIRDRLIKEKIIHRKKIIIPEMVSYEDMALVHNEQFLMNIRDPLKVARFLKLENVGPWDSQILEYFRMVTGGTVYATQHAVKDNSAVFNLGGGFHHAHADYANGYCLINDIAIAIRRMQKNNLYEKFLVIDLDYHQGDGNLQIFKNDTRVFTFSMHASHWLDINKKNNIDIILPENCNGHQYMKLLKSNLPDIFNAFQPDIVYYIAGSDVYENDIIGDLKLSRDEILERNMYVFEFIKSKKIPMIILSGGGYGKESWKIYYDFIKTSLGF